MQEEVKSEVKVSEDTIETNLNSEELREVITEGERVKETQKDDELLRKQKLKEEQAEKLKNCMDNSEHDFDEEKYVYGTVEVYEGEVEFEINDFPTRYLNSHIGSYNPNIHKLQEIVDRVKSEFIEWSDDYDARMEIGFDEVEYIGDFENDFRDTAYDNFTYRMDKLFGANPFSLRIDDLEEGEYPFTKDIVKTLLTHINDTEDLSSDKYEDKSPKEILHVYLESELESYGDYHGFPYRSDN